MDKCRWIIGFVLLRFQFVLSSVRLNVVQRGIQLGKPLQLSCEIKEDTMTGSRKWLGGKGKDILCLNGISAYPAKYREVKVSFQKYLLNIAEVTESDLNCPFACRFGFLTDEIYLSINASGFKHLPVVGTSHVEYFQKNGLYNLSITFDKAFPVPSCKLKTRHRLSTKSDKLTVVSQEQNGIFYRVRFSNVSKESFHSCDNPVEIECNIKDYKLTISHRHNLDCSHPIPSSNESSKYHVVVITLLVALILFVGICCVAVGRRFHRRKNHRTGRHVETEENLESKEPFHTDPNTTPLTDDMKFM